MKCKFAFITNSVNKHQKKSINSNSSIPEAATFFPMSVIVKPLLEDQSNLKASLPNYQNVETIAAIQRV